MARRSLVPVFAMVVALSMMAFSAHTAHADPRDFTLINGSSTVTLTHVYVEPAGPEEFSDNDILGQEVLAPGESVLIYFTRFTPDQCLYDIKVVFKDGGVGQLLNVNLCETDTVTFS